MTNQKKPAKPVHDPSEQRRILAALDQMFGYWTMQRS
jgi:hypothetical protein